MVGCVEKQDSTTVIIKNNEYKKASELGRRNREKIERDRILGVVLLE
jgi:hypothetical protein